MAMPSWYSWFMYRGPPTKELGKITLRPIARGFSGCGLREDSRKVLYTSARMLSWCVCIRPFLNPLPPYVRRGGGVGACSHNREGGGQAGGEVRPLFLEQKPGLEPAELLLFNLRPLHHYPLLE